MSQRDRYEPGVPCWVTTMQPDVDAAAEYYGAVFGWEYADGGGFLTARLHGRDVAAVAPIAPGFDPPPPPGWITQVSVETADDAAERAERAGGRIVAGPLDSRSGACTSSRTPPARCSTSGSPAPATARSSSTSPARGR